MEKIAMLAVDMRGVLITLGELALIGLKIDLIYTKLLNFCSFCVGYLLFTHQLEKILQYIIWNALANVLPCPTNPTVVLPPILTPRTATKNFIS